MMDRRKALMALVGTTVGLMSGRAIFASDETTEATINASHLANLFTKRPNRIVWSMDDIDTIELRWKGAKIEIKTSEIFEALKEGR
jgi:hypothetical protein